MNETNWTEATSAAGHPSGEEVAKELARLREELNKANARYEGQCRITDERDHDLFYANEEVARLTEQVREARGVLRDFCATPFIEPGDKARIKAHPIYEVAKRAREWLAANESNK